MSSEARSSENRGYGVFSSPHERLLGNDPRIREINALVRRLAPTNLTVFLTGETGTGKDIVAALIHRLHSRAKSPFVKVHCPSIPEAVLESELFGHDRGAFTGAHTSRPGRLEVAGHGTLFLDEICSISLRSQSKLIPVLDGEPFMRDDLPDIVRVVRKTCPHAAIIISTNGLLPDRTEEQMKRKGVPPALKGYNFAIRKGKLPWPVSGKVVTRFGLVIDRETKTKVTSRGIEILTKYNEPVSSVGSGSVAMTNSIRGYGNFIIIYHPENHYSVYGHLSDILVNTGDIVDEGMAIGTAGSTGLLDISDAQLKLEVLNGSEPEDPLTWLRQENWRLAQ